MRQSKSPEVDPKPAPIYKYAEPDPMLPNEHVHSISLDERRFSRELGKIGEVSSNQFFDQNIPDLNIEFVISPLHNLNIGLDFENPCQDIVYQHLIAKWCLWKVTQKAWPVDGSKIVCVSSIIDQRQMGGYHLQGFMSTNGILNLQNSTRSAHCVLLFRAHKKITSFGCRFL